jgi:hypothetical protein
MSIKKNVLFGFKILLNLEINCKNILFALKSKL